MQCAVHTSIHKLNGLDEADYAGGDVVFHACRCRSAVERLSRSTSEVARHMKMFQLLRTPYYVQIGFHTDYNSA